MNQMVKIAEQHHEHWPGKLAFSKYVENQSSRIIIN